MIKFPELRVIVDQTGENLGVIKTYAALKKAEELQLDLVLISDKAIPPVAKIIDYGKYRFEKKKEEKSKIKKQKVIETKEIRLSVNIGQHDIQTKERKSADFLKRGDKVRITLKLKPREIPNKSIAEEKINSMISNLKEISIVEKDARTHNFFDILLASKIKK